MLRKIVIGLLVAAMCLLVLVVGFLLFVSLEPHTASVSVQQQGKNLNFQFRTRGVNGLLDILIWRADTKEPIWYENLDYYNENHLKYGEVPMNFKTFNGAINSAEQTFPTNGQKPSPLPPNIKFFLRIDYQYDTFAAFAGVSDYAFVTDANGNVSAFIPIHIAPDDLPKLN